VNLPKRWKFRVSPKACLTVTNVDAVAAGAIVKFSGVALVSSVYERDDRIDVLLSPLELEVSE
jgi:hypothetical protein